MMHCNPEGLKPDEIEELEETTTVAHADVLYARVSSDRQDVDLFASAQLKGI